MSEIYFGDCFENMKKIKDKSIKLVLLDLPYGQTACKWDSCIDLNKMWIEFDRICDNKCQYLFFCSTKFGVSIINSRPNWFRTDFVFKKTLVVGFLSCKFNPLRAHEMIYVFSNPKYHKKTFNIIKTNAEECYNRRRIKREATVYGKIKPNKDQHYIGRFQTSIFTTKIGNNKSLHPTQKPIDVLELLIRTYSNEDDFVLDITAGSGSVGHACINTNRKYICIENDWKYYNIMYKRLFIENLKKELLD